MSLCSVGCHQPGLQGPWAPRCTSHRPDNGGAKCDPHVHKRVSPHPARQDTKGSAKKRKQTQYPQIHARNEPQSAEQVHQLHRRRDAMRRRRVRSKRVRRQRASGAVNGVPVRSYQPGRRGWGQMEASQMGALGVRADDACLAAAHAR